MLLKDFLTFVAGVGVVAAVSWVWEYFGWGADMEPKKKQMLLFLVCAVVALGAYCVTVFVPQSVLEQVAPFFAVIASVFSYLFLGSGFHAVTKDKSAPTKVTIVEPVVVPPEVKP
jgi:FtsH-binding integral membrane protein